MNPLLQNLRDRVSRLLAQPVSDLTRLQKTVRYMLEVARLCVEQLNRDRAAQMAAALTYRTIFSLVPTIILALLVFRAFVSFDQANVMLQERVYDFFQFDAVQLQAADESGQTVRQTLEDTLSSFVQKGYQLNVASVGGVGLLLLVWAALAMVITVEQCFNRVFNCPHGRTWRQRIILYWFVLTFGPVLLTASLYLTGRLYGVAAELPVVGALFQMLGSFAALGASWLLLTLIYIFLPNTKVQLRPALIGALVAAILWELGKIGFKLYVTKAVTYSAIYGSLGMIPLFLLWMYLTWLIVLFGLELTHVLQTVRDYGLERRDKTDERDLLTDSRTVLPLMTSIGQAFRRGKSVTAEKLTEEHHLPAAVVERLCRRLQQEGLVHQLDHGGYTLARPAEQVRVDELLTLARSLTHLDTGRDQHQPGWALLAELNARQTQAAADKTLADAMNAEEDE